MRRLLPLTPHAHWPNRAIFINPLWKIYRSSFCTGLFILEFSALSCDIYLMRLFFKNLYIFSGCDPYHSYYKNDFRGLASDALLRSQRRALKSENLRYRWHYWKSRTSKFGLQLKDTRQDNCSLSNMLRELDPRDFTSYSQAARGNSRHGGTPGSLAKLLTEISTHFPLHFPFPTKPAIAHNGASGFVSTSHTNFSWLRNNSGWSTVYSYSPRANL